MTMRRSHGYFQAVLVGAVLYATGALLSTSYAQTNITADSTFAPADRTVVAAPVPEGAGNRFDISGGRIEGGVNQFHSFDSFSVGTNDIGNFTGPATIQYIVSRVTGADSFGGVAPISNIDGILRSSIDGASLFLMNPSGIMFGPNAQLQLLNGSFHATTADYIALADGRLFNAVPSGADALLTADPPSAFGFLATNPFTASIDVQAGVFDPTPVVPGGPPIGVTSLLQVRTGQTLSFVSSEVNLGNPAGAPPAGFVRAPGGRVNLVSVASAGDATFDGVGFNVDSFEQLGAINIRGGSVVDGREVFIRGGQFTITDATIWPGFYGPTGPTANQFAPIGVPTPDGSAAPPPNGGEVNIGVSGAATFIHSGGPTFTPPGIIVFNGFAGGPVGGDGPDVNINADSVLLSGADILTTRLGPGVASDVTVIADTTVELRKGGSIRLSNFFGGGGAPAGGGTLTVKAKDVTLSNDGSPSFTGFSANATFHPAYGRPGVPFFPFFQFPDSGAIVVNATGDVTVSGSAQIVSDSLAFGRSAGITVNADNLSLVGEGAETGAIASQSVIAGNAGNVQITAAGDIEIGGGFRVTANTGGSGAGGKVDMTADGSITLTGAESRILSGTLQQPDEQLDSFARLFSPVFQFLGAGPIPDYATLRAVLGVEPRPGDLMDVLGVLSTIVVGGTPLVAVTDFTPGNAGSISINTPVLTMNAGTRIETSTGWGDVVDPATLETSGNAGDVIANVGSLFLNGGAAIRSTSGIQRLTGERSFGLGEAGSITITADDSIVLSGGSSISTEAELADGGNIKLTAPNIVQLTNSEITTSIFGQGAGDGGNINIDPEFVILNNSKIIANAFAGKGGNIQITASNFIPSADSLVQASSQFGVQGTVVVASPENNIAGAIAQLPQNIVDVSGLLPERCAARRAGGAQNSFVVAGRGGLPTNPDNYLPSFSAGSVPLKSAGGPPSDTTEAALTSARDIAVAMAAWNCVPGSERRVNVQEVISQLF